MEAEEAAGAGVAGGAKEVRSEELCKVLRRQMEEEIRRSKEVSC